jgi:hypothetical protein
MEIPGTVRDMMFRVLGPEGGLMKNPRFLSSLVSKQYADKLYPILNKLTGPKQDMAFKRLLTEIAIKEDMADSIKDIWSNRPKTIEQAAGAADRGIKSAAEELDALYQ